MCPFVVMSLFWQMARLIMCSRQGFSLTKPILEVGEFESKQSLLFNKKNNVWYPKTHKFDILLAVQKGETNVSVEDHEVLMCVELGNMKTVE